MVTLQRGKQSVGEKVRILREHHGVTQEQLSTIILSKERVARVESGEEEYTDRQLLLIKGHFKLRGLPLTDDECEGFENRMHHWRELLRTRSMPEARRIYGEVTFVDRIEPYAPDLVMQCKLIEVQYFITDNRPEEAEIRLNILKDKLEKMNDECLYYYHHTKGHLDMYYEMYERALVHLQEAYKVLENNKALLIQKKAILYHNIAVCHTHIEMPYKSIIFMQKAQYEGVEAMVPNFELFSSQILAINYIKVNELDEAERLLKKCIAIANGLKSNEHIGYTAFIYGYMHKKAGNWTEAIDSFEKATKYLPANSNNYFASLYHGIHAHIGTRQYVKSRELLQEAEDIYINNQTWTVYFEALGHYLSLRKQMTYRNEVASNYILDKAIPFFIEMNDHFVALDYYILLEEHFESIRSHAKSTKMAKAIRNIYQRVFCRK
ncbi:MAG: helix-turn-helix transcriptional regulator [Defluviitaleaceae bacterium]|nr:helix-turn-helix transcriptional regulator [Defluviitaleaceae bacterium]